MIPKGNQRGGGQRLATHLLNQFDNDNVEVADLRGAVAQDLHGAMHEWFAQSKATKCVQYLYSLSINPDVAKYDLTREQYFEFIARVQTKLGLDQQPRAVVFHTKHGRLHCHAVWSRILPDAGKAVQMDHDRYKLQDVAREFAHDHGLPLPPGMEKKGSSDKQKQSDLKEKQQQERSGVPKEERMAAITAVWYEHNEDPHAFVKALEKAGYHLARSATGRYAGDKGRYVVIDQAGDVHALARQIEGVRTKQIKAFLGADYPLEKLRDVETARAAARQDREAAIKEEARERPEDNPAVRREQDAKERREELSRHHAERRSQLDVKSTDLEKRIDTERRALLDLQAAEKDGVLDARAAKQPRGMLAFLARITGIQAYMAVRHSRQDAAREKSHKAERDALDRRHGRERHNMQRQYAGLAAVETRERQSLEIALKRREFQLLVLKKPPQRVLKPEFDRAVNRAVARQAGGDSMAAKKEQLLRDFAAAADPRKARQKTGDAGQSPKVRPAPAFTKTDLQRAFELAKDPARKPAAGGQERTEEVDPEKLEQAREKKGDLEKRQRGREKDRDPDRER